MRKNALINVPDEIIMNKILLPRGHKVMLDRDLAELYGTTTIRLNEQVKRDKKRFPLFLRIRMFYLNWKK